MDVAFLAFFIGDGLIDIQSCKENKIKCATKMSILFWVKGFSKKKDLMQSKEVT